MLSHISVSWFILFSVECSSFPLHRQLNFTFLPKAYMQSLKSLFGAEFIVLSYVVERALFLVFIALCYVLCIYELVSMYVLLVYMNFLSWKIKICFNFKSSLGSQVCVAFWWVYNRTKNRMWKHKRSPMNSYCWAWWCSALPGQDNRAGFDAVISQFIFHNVDLDFVV